MKGFEPRFTDFPDYILKITEEIWEQRRIGSLQQYYSDDIVVRTPNGIATGNAGVIAATMQTLSEFPDRVLLGEDVIWSGTPETGMLSSHRILSTATHLGDGIFGKASGKSLTYRAIANCHAIDNKIDDEWLIRDTGAIVRQTGQMPKDFAQAKLDGGEKPRPFISAMDLPGPAARGGNDDNFGQQYAEILTQIMRADFGVIGSRYDRAIEAHYPGGSSGYGRPFAERFWLALRSSFPSASFTIHQCIGRADTGLTPRAALFFALEGLHEGHGYFGPPTGKPVYVMGAAHAEFGPYGVRREWVLFDEVAIWLQILSRDWAAPDSV